MAKVRIFTYEEETHLKDLRLYYEVTLEDLNDFYTKEEIEKFQAQEQKGIDPDYVDDEEFLHYLEEKHENLIKRDGCYA